VPTGGTDTRASSPQQIDFRAPAQFDFSENAAPPQTPPDPDERMRARRTPAGVDRRADRPADEPVPGSLRALDAAKAENASSPSAAAPRRLTNRRVEDEDEDASALLRSPE